MHFLDLKMKEKQSASVKIKKAKDAAPFAGKIVGYECIKPSFYFTKGESRYQVEGSKDSIFGLISTGTLPWAVTSGASKGFNADILLKKGEVHSSIALVDQQIAEYAGGELQMRLASKNELKEIADAIKSGQAEFSADGFSNEGLMAVMGQLESIADIN